MKSPKIFLWFCSYGAHIGPYKWVVKATGCLNLISQTSGSRPTHLEVSIFTTIKDSVLTAHVHPQAGLLWPHCPKAPHRCLWLIGLVCSWTDALRIGVVMVSVRFRSFVYSSLPSTLQSPFFVSIRLCTCLVPGFVLLWFPGLSLAWSFVLYCSHKLPYIRIDGLVTESRPEDLWRIF